MNPVKADQFSYKLLHEFIVLRADLPVRLPTWPRLALGDGGVDGMNVPKFLSLTEFFYLSHVMAVDGVKDKSWNFTH